MRIILIAAITLSLFATSYAQDMDYLEEKKLAVDTLFFSNQELALELSEEMLPIALSSKDSNYITYFLDQAGELNRMAGNFDRAIDQLNNCLSFKVKWEDLKDLSLTHNNLGKTYAQKGLYELAIFHFFEALRLMEEDNNLIGQAFYLNNIAATYDLQHNYIKALEFYQKSLSIKGQLGDEKGMAASFTNIGISYFNLGDFKTAATYHEKAVNKYFELGDTTRWARASNNLTRTLIENKSYKKAQEYSNLTLSMIDEIYDEKLEMDILINAALLFTRTDQLDKAEMMIDEAIIKAKHSNSMSMLKTGYLTKSELLSQKDDYSAAYEFLLLSIAYNDSLINETNIYAVADIQGKYEYERQQKEIAEGKTEVLEKEKMIETQRANLTFWIGIAVITFLLVVLFALLYFTKQKNSLLLKGQLALLATKKDHLESLNEKINAELDNIKISLDEKEQLLENVFNSSKEKDLPPELINLSKREIEVLSYLALGWSDDQLAERLFVSKSTVKTHLRRIYSKLLVRGRAEAVMIAHKYSIIGEV